MQIQTFIEKAKRDYMRKPQGWTFFHSDYYSAEIAPLQFMLVSERDYPIISKYRWYLKDGYVVTSIAGKRVKMHTMVRGAASDGFETDHINRNRLDNRYENLRLITRQQNAKNVRPGKGYRRKGSGYEAYIQSDKKWISLGIFPTEEGAAGAYKNAKAKLHAI